jgi:hypothetical protein
LNFLFCFEDPKSVEKRKRTPPSPFFYYLTYSWCTHFAATCSRPPGAAPLALPSPSSAIVCVHTRLGQQEGGEEINTTRTCNLHCNKRSLHSSWLHLFSLVALSLSLCRHSRNSERKFILSRSRQTFRACVVHNLTNCFDHNSLLYRMISLFVNPQIFMWPCTLCQQTNNVSSFTFLVLVLFLQQDLNILGLTNETITLYLDTLQDFILATILK